MVTIQPVNSKVFISSGIAVISLDFSLVLICPKLIPFSTHQAFTIWMAALLDERSWERRTVFPSIGTTLLFDVSKTDLTQFKKQFSSSSTDTAIKNRRKVCCVGIPLGNCKNSLNQSYLALP